MTKFRNIAKNFVFIFFLGFSLIPNAFSQLTEESIKQMLLDRGENLTEIEGIYDVNLRIKGSLYQHQLCLT